MGAKVGAMQEGYSNPKPICGSRSITLAILQIFDGIAPNKEFDDNLIDLILVRSPRTDGIPPVSALFDKSNEFLTRISEPKDVGIVPTKLFLFKVKICKVVILPISLGIVDPKQFLCIDNVHKVLSWLRVDGMVPKKLLSNSCKRMRLFSAPIEDGIVPTIPADRIFILDTAEPMHITPVQEEQIVDTGTPALHSQPLVRPIFTVIAAAKSHIADVSGSTLGREVGKAVGLGEGNTVGVSVGLNVGLGVGLNDGREVGRSVGWLIG